MSSHRRHRHSSASRRVRLRNRIGRQRAAGPRFETLEDRRLLAISSAIWEELGPAPILKSDNVQIAAPNNTATGAINVVLPHPSSSDVIYAGTVNGGVWKTVNATSPSGPTWANLTPNEPSLSIRDLEFDLTQPLIPGSEVLVAGIARTSSFLTAGGPQIGLLRSTNGGNSWTTLDGNGLLASARVNAVVPVGDVIFAAADSFPSDDLAQILDNSGIFFVSASTPAVSHLISPSSFHTGAGLDLIRVGRVLDLVRDPVTPTTMFAAIRDAVADTGTTKVNAPGIYRTIDGGNNWTRVSDLNVNASIVGFSADLNQGAQTDNIRLSITRANGQNFIYAGIVNNGKLSNLFRWDNVSPTWQALNAPSVNQADVGQGAKHFSLVADAANPDIVYLGGDILKPSNIANLVRVNAATGQTTVLVSNTNAPHPDSRALAVDLDGNLIEGDDGGIFKLTNPLANGVWSSLNGDLRITEVVQSAWDANRDLALVATQDNGTAIQARVGQLPFTQLLGGDGVVAEINDARLAASELYYSVDTLGELHLRIEDNPNHPAIVPTVDKIVSLRVADQNGQLAGNARLNRDQFDATLLFAPAVAINAIDPARLAIGSQFLYESANRGEVVRALGGVQAIGNGKFKPINPLSSGSGAHVLAIAAGGVLNGQPQADLMYVGMSTGEVFVRTSGNGLPQPTGSQLAFLSGGDSITDIQLDPTNGMVAYATTPNHVFRTGDAGNVWQEITANLTNVRTRGVEIVKGPNGTDALFAVTSGGVFTTNVNAVTGAAGAWSKVGAGDPHVLFQDLEYDTQDDVLLAGTLGRGAWILRNIRRELAFPQILRTGDAVLVQLPGDASQPFALDSFEVLKSNGDVVSLTVQRNPLRGDLDLLDGGIRVATLVLSDRLTGEPLSQAGSFAFAANATLDTPPSDALADRGFQGVVRVHFRNGATNNTLDLEVTPGMTPTVDFLTSNLTLNALALQQRLNFLGVTDLNNQTLAADGIFGPLTESSLQKFQAGVFGGTPDAQTASLDQHTLRRLNEDPSLPLTINDSDVFALAGGLTDLGGLLAGIDALGELGQPLPLVGATAADVIAANPSAAVTVGGQAAVGELLSTQLVSPFAEYLGFDPTPTDAEFTEYLTGRPDVTGLQGFSFDITPNLYRVSADLVQSVVAMRPIDLGPAAAAAGVTADGAAGLEFSTTVNVSLAFGLDLTQPDPNEAFFLEINNFTTDVLANGGGALDLSGGFIDLAATAAAFSLNGQVQLAAADPGGNGARLTLGEIRQNPLSSVLDVSAGGSATGMIPVAANLFGVNQSGAIAVGATNNLFNPEPLTIDLSGLGALKSLLEVDPTQLGATVSQLGTVLQGLRTSDVLSGRVQFTDRTKLGEAIDPAGLWHERVGKLFETTQDQAAVKTLQELVSGLGASLSGGDVDAATKTLSLNFTLTGASPPQQVRLGFAAGLGDFTDVVTNSDAELTGDAAFEFTLSIDLSQPIGGGATYTDSTLLADLNGGRGVMGLAADGSNDLRVTLSNGAAFEVALDGALTLGEVASRIRAAVPATTDAFDFEVRIDGDHLLFVDRTRGDVGDFSIKGVNGSLVGLGGVGLGIYASLNKPNAAGEFAIKGLPLHGDTLANHAYLAAGGANVPKLSGVANLVANDIDANGKLNLAPVALGNGAAATPPGTGASRQTFSTTLKDPSGDGRLTLAELKSGLANVGTIANPSLNGGSSSFSLPASGALPWGTVASDPGVTISWADLSDPNTIAVDYGPQLPSLRDYGAIDRSAIGGLLDQAARYLAQIEAVSFLSDNIPLLDDNIGDLVQVSEKFRTALDDFGDDVIDSLATLEESLETAVEKALGLPISPGDGSTVELLPDETPGRRALRVEIDYNPTYAKDHRLNLDLGSLGVPAIGNLVDARGSAMFAVAAGAHVHLDLGLDLSDSLNPRPFLYNTTAAALGAKIYGSGIQFETALGPLGIAIGNGTNNNGFLVLDGDGVLEAPPNPNDQAGVTVGLSGADAAGRVYFDAFTSGNLATPAVGGRLNLSLPVYKTDKTTLLDPANPNLQWQFNLNDLAAPPAPTAVPNFAAVFDALRLDGALDGFRDGWDGVFQVLDVVLDESAFLAKIPLVGDQLKDAANFVNDLRDRVLNNFDSAGGLTTDVLRQKIYEAVGPGGLNWLQDRNGNGIQIDDVVLSPGTVNAGASEVRVDMTLGKTATLVNLPLGFDLGLPLVGLELDGGIQLKAGFQWNFGFGVSKTQGFFLSTAATDELAFTIDATIPDFAAKGSLGFFQVDATDNPAAPTHVSGQIVVDLLDPSGDGRLTLGELSSLSSFTQIVDARFTGNANVNLKLQASFGGNQDFPSIGADFSLDWNFANASTESSATAFGGAPILALNNVSIDAGHAISKLLGPILGTVDDVLAPIKPLLDVLNTPLPVVSDLIGSPYTLIDLAETLSITQDASTAAAIHRAKLFIDIASQLSDLSKTAKATGSLMVNIGSFNLSGGGGIPGLDIRNTALASLDESALGQITGLLGNIPLVGEVAAFLDSTGALAGLAGGLASDQGGFDFPIIKQPMSVVQALLGGNPEDIVFFTFQTPKLEVEAFLDLQIPIFPPFLTVFLSGGITAEAQFGFGFDASGMAKFVGSDDPADIFDGFYVSDRQSPSGTGPDVDEVKVQGAIEVGAFAGVDLGVVDISAGAKGGVYAAINANLNDPNNSGRVHPSEFAALLDQGFECLVDTQGDIHLAASIYVTVEALFVTLVDEDVEFARATLVDFSHHCDALSADPGLGSLAGGVLTLLLDPAGDDAFRVFGGDNGGVVVKARGKQQIFNGVTSIIGDAGAGNDSVQIAATINLPVTFFGGDGDDLFTLGGGPAEVHGGAGNDKIDAALAGSPVRLFGDDGDDVLTGGRADDELRGGMGRDQIRGGLGNDMLYGEQDDDDLFGGSGDDRLEGNDGNDKLSGEAGNDLLLGGTGADRADGADGDDEIHGDDGDDTLVGGDGVDRMFGGLGNDNIDGGLANDVIEGNEGDDFLDGGRHNDLIRGGIGNDVIIGGLGSDDLFGDEGNDRIIAGLSEVGGDPNSVHHIDAGEGFDVVYGDVGPDVILGGGDDDRIYSLAGDDVIDAGGGNDLVYGGAGSDRIVGGWGRDLIYAGVSAAGGGAAADKNVVIGDADSGVAPGAAAEEADTIYGDVGNDTVNAGVGDDTIYALQGGDLVEGGAGADLIYAGVSEAGGGATKDRNTIYGDSQAGGETGEDHQDRIFGDVGPDTVYAGASSDVVFTLAGNDVVFAGDGNDFVDTAAGNDQVQGDAGDDTITTGDGDDLVFGGGGNDAITVGDGDDFAVGGTGDDLITGGAGSDVLWGGNEAISFDAFSRDVAALSLPNNFPGQVWQQSAFGMQRLVPTPLAGLSVEGQPADGRDRITGDAGTDWLFGGGDADDLDGGADDDYVDGGSGSDLVRGGDGDDVVRGGSNDDVVRGDAGIDQTFGDAGVDHVYGDAGAGGGLTQSLAGQRLFGGDGVDYLYGFSFGTALSDIDQERTLAGDEMHGGDGGDWIFGSIRSEIIYGDAGNETIEGDAIVGPRYAEFSLRSMVGGDDVIYGGSGEDKLYGGGGDDALWGGFDSDWLEGQNGTDAMYGGSDIDIIYLDTNPAYDPPPANAFESFDGHFGNLAASDTPDDDATDILLVDGADGADDIRIGQVDYAIPATTRTGARLAIDYNGRLITAAWRDFFDSTDANGRPLVEQFRIAGLGDNDHIEFVSQPTTVSGGVAIDPLDVSDLDARSDDWIGVIDGGPGDDALYGTGARDRIDGGFGSDVIYGFAGDDQLWGDGGPGLGDPADVDAIYGGQGNDDLLGGVGRNFLYAWSLDPRADLDGNGVAQFGIFVDPQGGFHDDDGGGLYLLEDTGLNRVLGSANTNPLFGHDDLYGGSGLDFLYGNGAPDGDPDRLFDRHGNLFESLDGALAGDEWKAYAQSTNKAWYYGGSNLSDVITVDFVTEPGVLQGHHLITRLTENNGNFTFDAQVRLDFQATDADGNLIWRPDDTYYGLALTGATSVRPDGRLVDAGNLPLADAVVSIAVDGLAAAVTLPSAATLDNRSLRDLATDWNDSLQAAGLGGVLAARPNGGAISFTRVGSQVATPGSLVVVSANPTAESYFGLTAGLEAAVGFVGSNGLTSLLPDEGDFLAIIIEALDGDDQVDVGPTVTKSVWTDGGRGDDRIVYVSGKPILIDQTDNRTNGVGNGDQAHAYDFGLVAGDTTVTGLTIDSPTDQDWYKFELSSVPVAGEQIRVRSISSNDKMTARLVDGVGTELASTTTGSINLVGLGLQSGVNYFLRVQTDLIPTVYEVEFVTGAAANQIQESATDIGDSLDGFASILGRSLRTGADEAWYHFQLSRDAIGGDDLLMNVFAAAGAVTLTLVDSPPTMVPAKELRAVSGIAGDSVSLSLQGLSAGTDYWLEVSGVGPTQYELAPRMGGVDALDLSRNTLVDLADPILIERNGIVRKDVILGGEGNDVIQGGPGEDWIFGGPGNDVLAGGFDRQKGDLIWGGDGDDVYQILPDGQALSRAGARAITIDGQTTFVPTYSDRFDGGDGTDQALFLGGDLDSQGDPINDHVAIRWNTLLHRFEVSARVWDVERNEFVTESYPGSAVYNASVPDLTLPGLSVGRLAGDAVFTINVNGNSKTITVAKDSARFNGQFSQLVAQINAAFASAGLASDVVAEFRGGHLVFSTIRLGATATLDTTAPNAVAAAMGVNATTATISGSNVAPGFSQHPAYYTTVRTEQTVIDVRAGNDEVHADPEYLIRGSEWGIDPEDRPQRANPNLVIRGGAGSDRLFGGAGDDVISGGDDADVIVGGGGNDDLSGNFGDDWIAGGVPALAPDRYEFSSGQSNDFVAYASLFTDSLLPLRTDSPPRADVPAVDLNLEYGDRGDWYVIPTPEALKTFGAAKAAEVLRSMLDLEFTAPETSVAGSPINNVLAKFGYKATADSDNPDRTYFLFAAADTDPGSGLAPVPIDQFPGVPDYYLLHVANVNSLALAASAAMTTPKEYKLTGGGTITFELDGYVSPGRGNSIVVNLTADASRTSFTQVMTHVRSQLQNTQITYADFPSFPPFSLSTLIYVDQISQQDQRIGFWLTGRDASTMRITNVTGAASTLLHMETGSVDRFDPTVGLPPESMGTYSLTLKADAVGVVGIGTTLHVGADDAAVRLQSDDGLDRPVSLPIGDIDGDGFDDLIGFVQETGPAQWRAKVYFGASDFAAPDFSAPDFSLQLPFRYSGRNINDFVIASALATGDFNGDGMGDIAFVDGDAPADLGGPVERSGQVRIVLGRPRALFPPVLDAASEADVNIAGLTVEELPDDVQLRISTAGDLDGDGTDDLLIADANSSLGTGAVYVLLGRSSSAADGWRVWSQQPDLFVADFEDGLDGFQFSNQAAFDGAVTDGNDEQNLWHLTARRATDAGHSPDHSLYFGDDVAGTFEQLSVDGVPEQVLGRTYFTFDLSGLPTGAQLSLSYNYFLQTEAADGFFDRAAVNASSDFANPDQPIITLQSNQDRLTETNGVWQNVVSFDLGQFSGPTVQIGFDFDSVDSQYNNFEGWYVDDVHLRIDNVQLSADAHLARIVGTPQDLVGYSVSGIGDLTGDGVPEFAAISRQDSTGRILVFAGGANPWTPGAEYQADAIKYATIGGSGLFTYELLAAGDVIADAGPAFPDLIATSTTSLFDPVYLISGADIAGGGHDHTFAPIGRTTRLGTTLPGGYAVPLGDLDGVGGDELGLVVGIADDNVDESGDVQVHLVGQIFFGGDSPSGDRAFGKPDMVVEPGAPLYQPGGNPVLESWFFGGLGDVNGDGRQDFGIGDTLAGRRLSVYEGRMRNDNYASITVPSAADVYRYELARPLPIVPANPPRAINLGDPTTDTHYIAEAAVLNGVTAKEHLGTPRTLGDINGDRIDDFALSTSTGSYIVLGPMTLDQSERVTDRADLVVQGGLFSPLEVLADSLGNIDADDADGDASNGIVGTNDLLFSEQIGGTLYVSVVFGNKVLPRQTSLSTLLASDQDRIKHVTTPLARNDAGTAVQVFSLYWDGDQHADIGVFEDGNGVTVAPRLTIYSGGTALAADGQSPGSWTVLGQFTGSVTSNRRAAVVGDFNGDGLDDVILRDQVANQARLILGRNDVQVTTIAAVTNMIFSIQDGFLFSPVVRLGDVGRPGDAPQSSENAPDNYDDVALVVADEPSVNGHDIRVDLYHGLDVSMATITPTPFRSIARNGPIYGPTKLTPTAGDFNGDGRADLAILETVSLENTDVALGGTVYVFWDIAGSTLPTVLDLQNDADVTITSDASSGILETISSSPAVDIDGDGRTDLLLGAPKADVVDGALRIDAGRVYVIHGQPPQASLPLTGFEVLTNRTVTGSGDYVVDRATGQPARFDRTLAAGADADWFRFTTLGDGLSGNYLSVSPYATDPYAIRSFAAGTFERFGESTSEISPFVADTVTVDGGPEPLATSHTGLLEFDLSSVLRLRDDPQAAATLQLDYTSVVPFLPPVVSLAPNERAVVGNTIYFRAFGDGFGGLFWESDGTASGTHPVGPSFIFGSTDYRTANDHLYFVADGNLLTIDAEGSAPRVIASGVANLGEVVEVGGAVLFTSHGNLYSLLPADAPTLITAAGQPAAGVARLSQFDLGSAADQANVFFFADGANGDRVLYRYDVATQQTVEVLPDLFDTGEIIAVGGASGPALYLTAMDNQADGFRGMWRVTRSGNDTVVDAVAAQAMAAQGSPRELTDVGGTLLFAQGNVVGAVVGAGVQATLVKDFNRSGMELFDATIANLTAVDFAQGPRLVLSAEFADLSGNLPQGNELWLSDGTPTGTTLLADLNQELVSGRDTRSSDPAQLTVIGDQLFFTAYQGAQPSNRELWRSDGTPAGTRLAKDFQEGDAGGFSDPAAFLAGGASRLLMTADDGDGLQLWSDASANGDILRVDQNLGLTLTVETLFTEGDARIDVSDVDDVARFQFNTRLVEASGIHEVALTDGLQDAVREALRTGKTRMIVRLTTSSPNVTLNIQQSLAEKVFGALPGGPGGTRLVVAPSGGVLVDLFNDNGDRLADGKALVDLRNFDAGTYYARIYSPSSLASDLDYTIEIGAPAAGQTRTQYEDPDRDVLRGGDGNDVLAGNADIDRLFGGAGRDLFITDVITQPLIDLSQQFVLAGPEPRDFSATEDYPLAGVPAAESIANFKLAQLDPVISLPDPALRRKLADVLEIAATDAWTPSLSPLLARPLRGSDLAGLVELDLGYTTFSDLTGLEHAINLRSLNLSGTEPGDINALEVATSSSTIDAGAPLGPSRLEYLSFDFAFIDFLDPLTLMRELRALSMDGYNTSIGVTSFAPLADMKQLDFLSADGLAFVVPLDPLANLTALRTLSLTASLVQDITALSNLPNLQHVYLADNDIVRIDALVGELIADDQAPGPVNDGSEGTSYSESAGWQSNVDASSPVFHGDYRFIESSGTDGAYAQWSFQDVLPGDYEVLATWPALENHTVAANYQARFPNYDAATNLVNVQDASLASIDQRLAPTGPAFGGVVWQQLGDVHVSAADVAQLGHGWLELRLSGAGVLAADGVRLIRKSQPPLELVALDHNPLNNDAYFEASEILEPAHEDFSTPWREISYTSNVAPALRTSEISPNQTPWTSDAGGNRRANFIGYGSAAEWSTYRSWTDVATHAASASGHASIGWFRFSTGHDWTSPRERMGKIDRL